MLPVKELKSFRVSLLSPPNCFGFRELTRLGSSRSGHRILTGRILKLGCSPLPVSCTGPIVEIHTSGLHHQMLP
jgi:hypothetical protein